MVYTAPDEKPVKHIRRVLGVRKMNFFDFKNPEISNRIIAENEYAFSFLNKMPITPGHTLICPKRHIVYSNELSTEEWRDVFSLKTYVCNILRKELKAEGFNFAWNETLIAGQTIPHFHLHVVPRKDGDCGITEYEPRVFLYRPGSRADSPCAELITFAEKLREYS